MESERKPVRALESEPSSDFLREVVGQARALPDSDWRERIAFAKKVRQDTLEARKKRPFTDGVVLRPTV